MSNEWTGIEERWRVRGQKGDDLLGKGLYDQALATHSSLLADIAAGGGNVDSLPVSKSVLSMLICYVQKGDLEAAHELWTQDMESDRSLEATGIYAIESGRVEVHDLVLYFMVCARLHSFAGSKLPDAVAAVNSYMGRVCEYAHDQDPGLLQMAMTNWQECLNELFENTPSDPKFYQEFNEAQRRFKVSFKPGAVKFPAPYPWT